MWRLARLSRGDGWRVALVDELEVKAESVAHDGAAVVWVGSVGAAQEPHTLSQLTGTHRRARAVNNSDKNRKRHYGMYLIEFILWTWQKGAVEYMTYLTARGRTPQRHEVHARPSRHDPQESVFNILSTTCSFLEDDLASYQASRHHASPSPTYSHAQS
jgi:hypothetical protein